MMTQCSSSCNSVNMHRGCSQFAAFSAVPLSSAAIVQPSATSILSTGNVYTCSDGRYCNDTATPHMVNPVKSLVLGGHAKRILCDTSSCSDSNQSQSRDKVARCQTPRMNVRHHGGAAALRKIRSTRCTPASSAAAQAATSDEGNLHNSNLFIRNLDTTVNQADLEYAFALHGTILSSAVMRDIHTGESLGTAFVRMSSHEEAHHTMMEMNGALVGSRFITVQWAKRHEGAPVGEARKKIMKLFVRNVPLDCTKVDLEGLFGQYGAVRQVTLHKDTSPVRDEAMVRLIAFVIYTEEGAAERAAREVHHTKPFASCNGIPIMVKLAEDLAKPHRDHSHQHQQKPGQSASTSAAARLQPRRNNGERNNSARMVSKSPGGKPPMSLRRSHASPSSHMSSKSLSIRASCSSRVDAPMMDSCAAAEMSFCRNSCHLPPPHFDLSTMRADGGVAMATPLHQPPSMHHLSSTWVHAPPSILPAHPVQSYEATMSPSGRGKSVISTSGCCGSVATSFPVNSQQSSFLDFSTSNSQQPFFANGSASQLSRLAPAQPHHCDHLQLPRFRQLSITVPVTPSSYSLLCPQTVSVSQETGAVTGVLNPHVDRASNPSHLLMGSDPVTVFSHPTEESDSPIMDTAPATRAASLCQGRNAATTSPKLQRTYRHNPYINCSFIRVM